MNGLVLTRQDGQWLKIGDAWVQIDGARHGAARVRIVAPPEVRVARAELLDEPPPTLDKGLADARRAWRDWKLPAARVRPSEGRTGPAVAPLG